MRRTYEGFGGLVTALPSEQIAQNAASDLLNVTLHDGLKPRPGYATANLAATLSGIQDVRGFVYVEGYNASYSEVREYVAFLRSGGVVKPYSIDPITGTRTEITDGGSPLSLANSEWQGFAFDGVGYFFTPGGPVYRHDIGVATSWKLLDDGTPDQQVSFPQITFTKTEPDPTQAGTNLLDWTGATAANFQNNPDANPFCRPASFVSVTGSTMRVATADPFDTRFLTAFRIQDPAGVRDWSQVTKFSFVLDRVDGKSWFTLNGANQSGIGGFLGSSDGFGPDWGFLRLRDNTGNTVDCPVVVTERVGADGAYTYLVEATIPVASRGAQWSDTRFLHLELAAARNQTSGPTYTFVDFRVSSVTPDAPATATTPTNFATLTFAVAAYNAGMDCEALTPTDSAQYRMDTDKASTFYNASAPNVFMGNQATINVEAGAITAMQADQGVTGWRAYVKFSDEANWRYLADLSLPTSTYTVPFTYDELRERPERKANTYNPIGNVVGAAVFREWVVWMTPGGKANIRHTKVGAPKVVAKDIDNADPEADFVDENRGADFTLSDNFGEQGVVAFSADRTLIILSNRAAYAQTGERPVALTPTKRIAGSYGVFSASSACRWKDDAGRAAVVYLDDTGERLWMIPVIPETTVDNDQRVREFSLPIRGSIKDKLFGGTVPTSAADRARVQLIADWRNDRLILRYGLKALVLDKDSLLTGRREWLYWEFAEPALGQTFERWVFAGAFGTRALLSSGAVREMFQTYSSGAFTPIGGATPDGGAALPGCYWQGPYHSGPGRQSFWAQVERINPAEASSYTVTAYYRQGNIHSGNESITVAANLEHARFYVTTRGNDISYRVALPAGSAGVVRFSIEEKSVMSGKQV